MLRCLQCGWPMPTEAKYCPSCGVAVAAHGADAAAGAVPVMITGEPSSDARPVVSSAAEGAGERLPIAENVAGVIAYITIFPAIAFLLLEPFKRNRFVRFHSLQHILLWAVGVGFGMAAGLAAAILQLIPFMRVLVFPLAGLVSLAWFFLWLLLVVKAYNHEMFKLPILGDLAEQWMYRQAM